MLEDFIYYTDLKGLWRKEDLEALIPPFLGQIRTGSNAS